jgi:lactate dehydrogenase-like 2-hydroxyacid dehydrogenase
VDDPQPHTPAHSSDIKWGHTSCYVEETRTLSCGNQRHAPPDRCTRNTTSAVARRWLRLPPHTHYTPVNIHDATIVLTTTVKLDAATLDPKVTPHLQCVVCSATGTDHVDLAAAKARGIRVTNCPGANLDAVSEHAISLYFAARRRIVLLDHKTREQPSEWKKEGSVNKYMRLPDGAPPLSCKEEVLGIIGYGGLG